jgi:hypothetical protein
LCSPLGTGGSFEVPGAHWVVSESFDLGAAWWDAISSPCDLRLSQLQNSSEELGSVVEDLSSRALMRPRRAVSDGGTGLLGLRSLASVHAEFSMGAANLLYGCRLSRRLHCCEHTSLRALLTPP